MKAGYSKRSLVEKLGIVGGMKVLIVNPPREYDGTLGSLPADVVRFRRLARKLDFIQLFVKERRELDREFVRLRRVLADNGALWVSWPKRSANVPTDLNENIVRDIGLENGLVDVKVCAIDDTWSGLKFVVRLKDRGAQ